MIDYFEYDFISEIEKEKKKYNQYDLIYFFEDTEKSEDKKKGAARSIVDTLKAVVQSIKKVISELLSTISNKLSYMGLSKKDKEAFDDFCKWVEKNPSVKNKKITVKDWKKISKEYDLTQKKITELYNDKNLDANEFDSKVNNLFDNLKSIANSTSTVITIDMAMYIARKSPEHARNVQKYLQEHQELVDNIENELSKKDAETLKKNINKLTKETVYQKAMTKLLKKKNETMDKIMSDYIHSFENLQFGTKVKDKAKTAIDHRSGLKSAVKIYSKNENIKEGISNISKEVDKHPRVKQVAKNIFTAMPKNSASRKNL